MKKKQELRKGLSVPIFDEKSFPKIAELFAGLTDTEKATVHALAFKEPSETWQLVAKRIGISERQLWNLRHKEDVRDAVYYIAKRLFVGELPDVLRTLARKAKEGEAWATKLFLEVAGETQPVREDTTINLVSHVRGYDAMSQAAEEALKEMQERLKGSKSS